MSTPYSRRGGGGWKGKRNYGGGSFKRSNAGSHASQQKRPPAIETEVAMDTTNCPYTKWGLYLKDYAYVEGSELANKVALLRVYFENNIHQFNKEEIEEKEEVYLDFQAIHSDHAFVKTFPTFKKDLKEEPTQIIGAMRTVLHQLLEDQQFEDSQKSCLFDVAFLHVRLLNFQLPTGMKDLKASSFGKLVSVNGTVVRVSNVKPIVTKMAFSCNSCSEAQVLHLPDGKYLAPIKCSSFDCRGRSFTPQRCSSSTETIDWQNVKLQEVMSDEQRETGRIPRTIECELTAGLVDSCVPGDKVTCTGIVKVTQAEESNGKKSKDKSVYLLYIHAISLSNNKQVQAGEKEADQSEFTMKELYAIQEIQSDKNSFRLIVGSLCPAIYGHVLVKAGLLLALFGGTQKYVDSRNLIPVRGDPHVLVVGDPGLGKSQMLQAAANVAPRGVYVCGNTTTTTGLTVTLSKEAGSGNYSLEAGALVLADRGCCCIDEFDKMGNQHQALLEAMEQQSISIAKAGILCSLPARTSILAAANPVGGHYNRGKTVAENLKMGSALLSRFDLVFILLDKPDEELDSILSEHVMSLHSEKARAVQTVTVERNQESRASLDQWNKDKPLLERLRVARGAHDFDALPPQLLRKYIQYARKYVHPQLSTQAGRVLQEFYLNLRKQRLGGNCTPITTRQLEALIRLTQARARAELRETATEQDANDVIEIMKSSLIDTFIDENGSLDYSRSQNGSGMSKRAQAKKFITELTNISERDQNSLFNMDQMHRIYKQLKLNAGSFEDFISSLNSQNFLLKKGPKLYQLQTSSCV